MKKVTIYSTKGKSGSFETSATKWGEIISQVENIVGDLSNLIPTENVGKTTLQHVDAVLPDTNFTLFLRPSKTKSGVDFSEMSFIDLRDFIKENPEAKTFLKGVALDKGKSWTQLSLAEIREGLEDYTDSAFGEEEDVEEMNFLDVMGRSELIDFIMEEGIKVYIWDTKSENTLRNEIKEAIGMSACPECPELQAELEALESGFIS